MAADAQPVDTQTQRVEITGSAIRRIEAERGLPRTPVIAVTASALAGDVEHCLAAGMDDFIAKPVELVALRQCLERWLPKAGSPGTRVSSGPTT